MLERVQCRFLIGIRCRIFKYYPRLLPGSTLLDIFTQDPLKIRRDIVMLLMYKVINNYMMLSNIMVKIDTKMIFLGTKDFLFLSLSNHQHNITLWIRFMF